MKRWFAYGGIFLVIIVLVALGVSLGLANSNSVNAPRLGITSFVIDANALKPPQCAGLTLVNIIRGSGKFNGSNQSDLILGSAGADDISGKNGDDCILGGGGNDIIGGDNGTDVCFGGPGTNTVNCETSLP